MQSPAKMDDYANGIIHLENIPSVKRALTDPEKNAVLEKLEQVYTSKPEWRPMWPIARDHLKKLQSQGYLEGLTIPD